MRVVMYVHPHSERLVLLRGYGLRDWLREQGIPAQHSRLDRGFLLHRDRYADTLAMAEETGVLVRIREAA